MFLSKALGELLFRCLHGSPTFLKMAVIQRGGDRQAPLSSLELDKDLSRLNRIAHIDIHLGNLASNG
jgi:hypothetical protein